jgi:hypothetical protein
MSNDKLKPNKCVEAWSATARGRERSSAIGAVLLSVEPLQRRVISVQAPFRLLVKEHDDDVLNADQGSRYRMLAPITTPPTCSEGVTKIFLP